MATLLWQRDVESDVDNVRNTFSSWDSCMAESYCKWPVIIGIIIGSLIVISVIWCCARCLCCGVECCCGCCSCFNRCCPSPRRRSEGYEKPQAYPYNTQYQSPAPPMYFGGGYRAPQTATFDSPSNQKYNEDALPQMPTWSTASSRRVEDDMELEKLDHHSSAQQQQGLLHQRHESEDSDEQNTGDIGGMQAMFNQRQGQANVHPEQNPYQAQPNAYHEQSPYQAQQNLQQEQNPYQSQQPYGQVSPYEPTSPYDYTHHQQFGSSPTSAAAPSVYPPTYVTRPPSSVYTSPYAAPPSYQTAPPSIASPTQQYAQMNNYGMGRRPVQGSWRDV